MSNNIPTLQQLQRGLAITEQIAALEAELASLFTGSKITAKAEASVPVLKKKGGMSAAGRARVAAAQKARWAKVKANQADGAKAKAPAAKVSGRKKRTMSPEARAKIAAAQKARWAKKKELV